MAIDHNSETWIAVKTWADKEHAKAMASLKSVGTSEADTNYVRGIVNTIEELRSLAVPKAPGPVPSKIKHYV